MKIALVDDRPEEIDRLLNIVEKALPHAKTFSFSSGEAFLGTWKRGEFDLILLDIFMDGQLGIEVARKVRMEDEDVRLVFCTTSNDFACESYEVGANYYLHKPISYTSFAKMLEIINLSQYEMKRFIRLPDGQRIVLRNVIYSEYHNHLITIHCKQGIVLQTRMSQTDWENTLLEYSYFYSCSKGIVVNFYEIEQQESGMFLMSDGTWLPISRRKTKDALEAFAHFRFEKMRRES